MSDTNNDEIIIDLSRFYKGKKNYNMSYTEQMKHPYWQRKRLEIFSRDNWKCTVCDKDTHTLHVHHIGYKGLAWEIDSNLLVTLCEYCHKKEEGKKETEYTRLGNSFGLIGFMGDDLKELNDILGQKNYDSNQKKKILNFLNSL